MDYFFVDLRVERHFEALRHFLLMEDGEFAQSLSDLLFEKVRSVKFCTIPPFGSLRIQPLKYPLKTFPVLHIAALKLLMNISRTMQINSKCISPFLTYKTFQQNILSPSEVLLSLIKEETMQSNIFPFCGGKNNRNSAFY